jgi:D-glycero-D-manno-heptose 1,7-bisphosphate phosphatase
MENGHGAQPLKATVFLDRDGVLNRALVRDGRPYAPTNLTEFEILPEVPAALARLKQAGFLLVVATNQPDVARGDFPRSVVEAMHGQLRTRLPIDDIKVCYEVDSPECRCYKPKPGMLLDAAAEYGIDLAQSFMIGDRWRDVDCGRNAGCFTIFIDRNYAEPLRSLPDAVCRDLAEAADIVLAHITAK